VSELYAVQAAGRHPNRWAEAARIVALWTLAAPALGAVMLFAETIVIGSFNTRYASSPVQLPNLAWQSVFMAYTIGAPVGFVTGVLFASFAGLARWRGLWAAILASLIPISLAHYVSPAIGDPIWQWDAFWTWHVLGYMTLPTTACWFVWRRWRVQAR
jgi:hypothetical protein